MADVRTRVMLFELETMLSEIIEEAVADAPDVELVAAPLDSSLAEAIERSGANAAITGDDDPVLAAELLGRRPQLKLLSIIADGRESRLYELQPQRIDLGEVDADGIIAALRDACGQPERSLP